MKVEVEEISNGYIVTVTNDLGERATRYAARSTYELLTQIISVYGYSITQLLEDRTATTKNYDHLHA